jgi:hypothetical protein
MTTRQGAAAALTVAAALAWAADGAADLAAAQPLHRAPSAERPLIPMPRDGGGGGVGPPVGRPHVTTAEAHAMLGNAAVSRHDELTGQVVDFLLRGPGGAPDAAVIAWGGVLGFGRRLVAVPVERLQADPARPNRTRVDMTRAEIEGAAPFRYGPGMAAMVGRR